MCIQTIITDPSFMTRDQKKKKEICLTNDKKFGHFGNNQLNDSPNLGAAGRLSFTKGSALVEK